MSTNEPEFWQRANQARDKLSLILYGRPEVTLIDLGYDPKEKDPGGSREIYLRVHVRQAADATKLALPPDIDGVPVIFIIADYRLE